MTKNIEWVCDGCGEVVQYRDAPPSYNLPLELDGWVIIKRLEAYGYADLGSIFQVVKHYCSEKCAQVNTRRSDAGSTQGPN